MAPELNILITNSHINLTLDMYFNFSKMGGACLSAITVEVILFFEKRYCKKKKDSKNCTGFLVLIWKIQKLVLSKEEEKKKKKRKKKRAREVPVTLMQEMSSQYK